MIILFRVEARCFSGVLHPTSLATAAWITRQVRGGLERVADADGEEDGLAQVEHGPPPVLAVFEFA